MREPEMPETLPALSRSASRRQRGSSGDDGAEQKGFGGKAGAKGSRRKSGKKRSPALSKADWGAIVARQRLHLPLSGRLTEPQVSRAWKEAAAEHHPDRGGLHDTMQLVNGARDLLLGRGV
jgi:curved DNA-binding protein CbpA